MAEHLNFYWWIVSHTSREAKFRWVWKLDNTRNQHAKDRKKGREEEYVEGREKYTAPPLGLEVITVLCTQNNWSHQCDCHTESLALPRHRCSPPYGQNPPIKPKLVAKTTPLYPNPLSENDSTFMLQLQLGLSSSETKMDRTFSVLRAQLCSGPIVLRSLAWKQLTHLQPNSKWQCMWSGTHSLSIEKSQLSICYCIHRRPRKRTGSGSGEKTKTLMETINPWRDAAARQKQLHGRRGSRTEQLRFILKYRRRDSEEVLPQRKDRSWFPSGPPVCITDSRVWQQNWLHRVRRK